MAMITDSSLTCEAEVEGLAFARQVLRIEAEALERVRDRLDTSVGRAADLICRCDSSVIVTGMGKAGLVGQKLAATLASTGTRAFPLHPAEAVHGDLGRIRAGDIVLALSQSGETEEVLRLVPALRRLDATLIAITERASSSLGIAADVCIALGPIEEACPLGLAPSARTAPTRIFLGSAVITEPIGRSRSPSRRVSNRRTRSLSVKIPASWESSASTRTAPDLRLGPERRTKTSRTVSSTRATRSCRPILITSSTRVSLRPRFPAGW